MKICYEQRPDALALAENKLELRFPSGTTWIASRYDDGSDDTAIRASGRRGARDR